MVFRLATRKITSRPISPEDEVNSIDKTFISIDTYIETSKRDEFIVGNLFDYDGNKISYVWDSKKNQVASLKGKLLNTEVILLATDFLKTLYIKQHPIININTAELSNDILNHLQELTASQNLSINSKGTIPALSNPLSARIQRENPEREIKTEDEEYESQYEDDLSESVFTSTFLEDDEEVDDFDEQLALKSQEFLKEHPELKSEMEIVRLLEGN